MIACRAVVIMGLLIVSAGSAVAENYQVDISAGLAASQFADGTPGPVALVEFGFSSHWDAVPVLSPGYRLSYANGIRPIDAENTRGRYHAAHFMFSAGRVWGGELIQGYLFSEAGVRSEFRLENHHPSDSGARIIYGDIYGKPYGIYAEPAVHIRGGLVLPLDSRDASTFGLGLTGKADVVNSVNQILLSVVIWN